MTLGSALKARRDELKWSLRDVEKKTGGGISNGYLSLLEADEVKQPSPRHLYMLAEVLGLDYAKLIELAGYVVPRAGRPAVPQGLATAGWEELTDSERQMVQDLVKQHVRLLNEARKKKSAADR